MKIQTLRSRDALPVLAVLALLCGCSTYSGEKLGLKEAKQVEPHGIPYTLVRAEYSLTRTPPTEGQKQPSYVIGVSYEPDPGQKYTLKINPGIFADPNFLMKLGAGGTLQGTTMTFTEQVTPAITALGSFAKDMVGALATGALDKDSVRKQIKTNLEVPECKVVSDVPRLSVPVPITAAPDPVPTVEEAIAARLEAFKDDEEFASLFHYVTERERMCLVAAKKKLDIFVTSTYKVDIDAWEKARDAYEAVNPTETVFIGRLNHAVKSTDTKAMDAINAEIITENDVALKSKRSALFVLASPAAEGLSGTEAQEKLDFFINMDSPTWRGRNLLYLERELDRVALLVLRRPEVVGRSEVTEYFQLLRRQRAETIGVSRLYERSLVLSDFIEQMQYKSVPGGKAPATAEYATARAELDAVLAQIDAQRTRVLSDAKPAPPPPAPALKAVTLRKGTQQEIKDSKAPNWIDGPGAKAADYVLILMEAP